MFYKGNLGVVELNEMHKAEYISEMFLSVLSQWGINIDQVIAILL